MRDERARYAAKMMLTNMLMSQRATDNDITFNSIYYASAAAFAFAFRHAVD